MREYLEFRFDSIETKLADLCDASEKRHQDHETRLRTVEARTTISRIIEGSLGVISAALISLRFKKP